MSERRSFTKNVQRDAALVEAAMRDSHIPLAIGLGMTPNEALVYHPKWLSRQPFAYREQVVQAVIELQDKMLTEVGP